MIVSAPPKIISMRNRHELYSCRITYKIIGSPLPEVTWYHNGNPLDKAQDTIRDAHTIDNLRISRSGCLLFSHKNHLYDGQYTLFAKNKYGNDTRTIAITVMKPPGE